MGEQVVVVGVDGSPASYTALRWVLAHAARIGAQVHAVRCWTPVVARKWEAAVTGEPVPPEAVQEVRAERELAQVVAAALGGSPTGRRGLPCGKGSCEGRLARCSSVRPTVPNCWLSATARGPLDCCTGR